MTTAARLRPQFNPVADLRPELHRAPFVRFSPPLASVRVSVSCLFLRSVVGVGVSVIVGMSVGVGVSVIMGVCVSVIVGVSVVHFFLKGDVGLGAPLARAVKHLGVVLVGVAVLSVGVAMVVVAVSVIAVRMAVSGGRMGR